MKKMMEMVEVVDQSPAATLEEVKKIPSEAINHPPQAQRSSTAFTLIELLVVVSIIGILFGVGIAAYNQFNRTQMVVQTGKQVKNYLRLAQSKALTGEKDVVCGSGPASVPLEGWFIDFSAKEIYGKCGNDEFGTIPLDIPNNVFVTYYGANPLKFKTLAGGAEVDTEATICISGFDKKYKLRVTSSGEIKDDGFTTCP
ncbi:MAG: pilus assembly FimT family protein [Patescibacteria group bacterium]